MSLNNTERNRVFILFIFFSLWVLVIGASLVKTQVVDYGKHVSTVQSQSNRIIELQPKRGTIYDCNGEILAISVKAKSAFLDNKNEAESDLIYKRILKSRIRLTKAQKKQIKKRINQGYKFVWIKRKITDSEYEIFKTINKRTKGQSSLNFIEEYKRIYPHNRTASHILGGVGIDEQGLYGIEYSLDSILRGKGYQAKVEHDARNRIFRLQNLSEPENGRDIYLTIDSSVQFFVEKELKETVETFNAKSGTVIVMDSRTGAILAMAGYPDYSPAQLRKTDPAVLKNKAISFIYHPGSTFKVILAATALQNNICSPQQMFNCYNGSYKVLDRTIRDDHAYDRLSFEDVVIYSSNIGAAKISERLGKRRYYDGIRKFGFGSRMGIRLPGEEKGILHPLREWSGVSLPYLSHGYEISVTPLQMIRAFDTIASGGFLLQPHVLKDIDGVLLKKPERKRILSSGTTLRMTEIMKQVVIKGTGKKAQIEGITVAAKTGTTKKIPRRGAIVRKVKYVSSFGGFFPARNPRVTMFVVVDEPKGLFYGGDVAAPLYKSIAEKLMFYLKIFPELDNKNEIRL
jgi:cell division protein FtsI/penicillin-binding protein 2